MNGYKKAKRVAQNLIRKKIARWKEQQTEKLYSLPRGEEKEGELEGKRSRNQSRNKTEN